jgi:ribosomal protein S12 methylthiotransferase
MARKYKQEDLKRLFGYIRDTFPEASLRTTVITGFPGETQEDFNMLKEFILEIGFDHLGVFTYSDEEETHSHNLSDKVPEKISLQRKKEIINIQKAISKKRLKRWKDQTVETLVEGISQESDLLYYGRTTHQAPDIDGVIYLSGEIKKLGEIVPVRINETHIYDMAGEAVDI